MLTAAEIARMVGEDAAQRTQWHDQELRQRRIGVRRFNPDEPRVPGGPHGGEWGSGGAVKALKDALKLGDKADLQPGEKLVGSDKLSADSGTVRMALVEGNGRKSLRLGIGGAGFGSRDDEAGPWRAGPDRTEAINAERKKLRDENDALERELNSGHPDPARRAAIEKRLQELDDMDTAEVAPGGYTANLDQKAAEDLRAAVADALSKADKVAKSIEHDPAPKPVPGQGGPWGDFFSADGTIPGQWADVQYAVYLDDPDVGIQVLLGAVPHGSGRDLSDLNGYEQAASLDAAEAKKFLRTLGQFSST